MSRLNERFFGFCTTKQINVSSFFDTISDFPWEKFNVNEVEEIKIKLPSSLVLGKMAERFFAERIKQSSNWRLIDENIQIVSDGITKGEFDFFLAQNDQLIHLELIYKFYLYDPSIVDGNYRWIGPNRKDTFIQKIEKLRNKQFPLLYSDAAKNSLIQKGISVDQVKQQVLFLANRFVPLSEVEKQGEFDGYWMNLSQFQKKYSSNSLFYIPEKKDWFIRTSVQVQWLNYSEIIDQLTSLLNAKKSPMLWVKQNNSSFERIFVVWWDPKEC